MEQQRLLGLLRRNARESTASLARKLGLARTTVQERINRLERDGVIAGYTVRVSEGFARQRIAAQVLINVDPKAGARVVAFEPNPMVWPELRARCGSNKNWTLVRTALGSGAGARLRAAQGVDCAVVTLTSAVQAAEIIRGKDFVQLKKHVAEAAAFSFALANLPEPIGPRFTRPQIEQSMRDTNSVEMFKAFGLWEDWESGRLGRQK